MDLNLFLTIFKKHNQNIFALKLANCLKVLNIMFSVEYGQHTAARLEKKHSSNCVLHNLCVFWKAKYWILVIIWEGANGKQGAL